ncbi:MAG: DUF308 domain-containing protein [Pseudomonadota bacterium]
MSDWLKWVLLGLLSILFGILALNHAVIASVSITLFVGAMFLVSGIIQAIAGFGEEGAFSKVLAIAMGVLMTILGFSFLVNPLQGTISLALVVTIFILAAGVVRLAFAFQMRGTGFFWMMLLSGLLSVGLGFYILANPGLTVALLGILLGVELLFNGAGLVALGLFKRTADRAVAT